MAIDSVSSAVTVRQPVQQPSESQVAADAKKAADQAAQTEKVAAQRQTEKVQREQQAKEAQQAQQSQPPKPVVNTQGQVTGQLLNEVA